MPMHRFAALLVAPLALVVAACSGGGGGSPADAGKAFFASSACPACHTLTGVPNAVGPLGPNLDGIATTAGTRKPGMSAEAYIRESIQNPEAFISPGFTAPSSMPAGQATGKDLDNLVAYLLTQK